MQLVDRPNGTFTNKELERLVAYRAAVAAGFYTDQDGSTEGPDLTMLAWLRPAAGAGVDGESYPFTSEERQRLCDCKAAIADGRYSDDVAPPAATETAANPEEAAG
jgi:hypothetical protein